MTNTFPISTALARAMCVVSVFASSCLPLPFSIYCCLCVHFPNKLSSCVIRHSDAPGSPLFLLHKLLRPGSSLCLFITSECRPLFLWDLRLHNMVFRHLRKCCDWKNGWKILRQESMCLATVWTERAFLVRVSSDNGTPPPGESQCPRVANSWPFGTGNGPQQIFKSTAFFNLLLVNMRRCQFI